VWNRGADRHDVFYEPLDQVRFENGLADAIERTGARVHAFSLMTNHFHALVEALGDQLSETMYHLGRSYAVAFNQSTGRTGPVFDGRFGSQPIVDPNMLAIEGRYVHRNPVDICGLDGLAAYRFSSLGVYAGKRAKPEWLTTDVLAADFDSPDRYLEFVCRTLPSDSQYFGHRPPLVRVDLDDLERAIVQATGIAPGALRASRRGVRNEPRIVAVTLASELRLGSSADLAARFGYASEAAVRNVAATGRAMIHREPEVAGLRRRVLDCLVAGVDLRAA
jgi:REP element-mobilizing transposase RayT